MHVVQVKMLNKNFFEVFNTRINKNKHETNKNEQTSIVCYYN